MKLARNTGMKARKALGMDEGIALGIMICDENTA